MAGSLCRSQDYGGSHAGLPANHGAGHSMNLESPALYAGYFGAWFGGLSGSEVAI
jgi:hypothetical protein